MEKSRRENEEKNVGKRCKKNTYKLYKPGEKVFIRLRRKGTDSLKKHRVFIGRILKRYEDDATYLVKVKIPVEAEPSVKKVWIENIANNSRFPKQNQSKQAKRKDYQNSFLIPLTRIDPIEEFTKQGYVVTHDSLGDGNCQFAALCYSLREMGSYRSQDTLRVEVVQFIEEHDIADGNHLELFTSLSWQQYLKEMSKIGTYDDEITLGAMANIFSVEIVVISTLGEGRRVTMRPEDSIPYNTLVLGHLLKNTSATMLF